jgi:hypothetical protein
VRACVRARAGHVRGTDVGHCGAGHSRPFAVVPPGTRAHCPCHYSPRPSPRTHLHALCSLATWPRRNGRLQEKKPSLEKLRATILKVYGKALEVRARGRGCAGGCGRAGGRGGGRAGGRSGWQARGQAAALLGWRSGQSPRGGPAACVCVGHARAAPTAVREGARAPSNPPRHSGHPAPHGHIPAPPFHPHTAPRALPAGHH